MLTNYSTIHKNASKLHLKTTDEILKFESVVKETLYKKLINYHK